MALSKCKDCRYYQDNRCYAHPPEWKPSDPAQRTVAQHPIIDGDDDACGEFKP